MDTNFTNPQRQTDSYNLGFSNDDPLAAKPATLTSSISFDRLNVNSQMVNTRYDNKSICASSLYGSKKSVAGGTVSFDTRGGHQPFNVPKTKSQRFKAYIMRKIFSDDTSYSYGEYQKDADGNIIDKHAMNKLE